MGIKYFFSWLRNTFSNNIKVVKMNNSSIQNIQQIDNFLIDMNGIFHYCCQKVYKYGSFKQEKSLLRPGKRTLSIQKQYEVFEMVGKYVDKLVSFVKPSKRLILAIDGPAPFSKQIQQRQRRYRSAQDNTDCPFDSNSITPGTKFLDFLSKYMDWYIHLRMNKGDWGNIEVIFSSEKVPGEGEHKLVKYVRDYGNDYENFMIHGMDADLIMLALATHKENFYILRENPYKYEDEYYYIDMKEIRKNLVNALLCDLSMLDDRIHINDFITMIFLTGNDFLPHLPTIDILSGGIENILETYRNVVNSYGSLTNNVQTLNIEPLKIFLGTLGTLEIKHLEEKRSIPIKFPDTLLEKHTKYDALKSKFNLDWVSFRKEYYKKMGCDSENDIKKACLKYVEGLQWVLTYYTKGVPNWKWHYPYYYAPFFSDIAKYIDDYKKSNYEEYPNNKPYNPFMQLLCVLPPKSSHLLPDQLAEIMINKDLYPEEIYVDFDGKHNDWEGVVILPKLDVEKLEKLYNKHLGTVEEKEKKRNFLGKTFVYNHSEFQKNYKSYYGELKNCNVSTNTLVL